MFTWDYRVSTCWNCAESSATTSHYCLIVGERAAVGVVDAVGVASVCYCDCSIVGEGAEVVDVEVLDAVASGICYCDYSRVRDGTPPVIHASAVSVCYCDCSKVGEEAKVSDARIAAGVYCDCSIVGEGAEVVWGVA